MSAALLAPEAAEIFLVTAVPYEPRFFRLHRLLARSPVKLGTVIVGVMPTPEQSGLRRLRQNARYLLDPQKICHILLKRAQIALKRLGVVRDFDVVFAAGSAAREQAGKARVVPIHHIDYDEWLDTRADDGRLVSGRYAVYLDQFAPSHPDYKFLGLTTPVDPVHYYAFLNAFFSRLEKKYDLNIVIAAHPKSDYPVNPFAGRKIARSSARALVRHCEFALATYSTALGYAVLDRKPLVFFTTDDIAARDRPRRLDALPAHFATVLGRPCVNLDHPPEEESRIDPVDAMLYDDYKYRYLVSRQSEGRPSREAYLDLFSEA